MKLSSNKKFVEVDVDFAFQVDPAKYQCLVFKNKTIVGPHSTDDLKILFLPCHSGIFQCILSVSSWPLSADAETVVQAEALASRVVLTAVAENPILEVSGYYLCGFCWIFLFVFNWNSVNNLMIVKKSANKDCSSWEPGISYVWNE